MFQFIQDALCIIRQCMQSQAGQSYSIVYHILSKHARSTIAPYATMKLSHVTLDAMPGV